MRPMPGMPPMHRDRPEGGRRGENRPERSLEELSVTVWLTPQNAVFSRKNGLLYLTLNEKEERVTLCREFPFDQPWEYISVMDWEHRELGIIRKTELFEGEARELIEEELKRRYYAPEIQKILSVRERYGFSYWKVLTERGEVKFTLRDTYRSILRVNDTRAIFSDVDGNRFEIPDVSRLDERSRRKLELYL